jgi:hypothetical protein
VLFNWDFLSCKWEVDSDISLSVSGVSGLREAVLCSRDDEPAQVPVVMPGTNIPKGMSSIP